MLPILLSIEQRKKKTDRINHIAVRSLAEIAKQKRIKLINFSVDYVFDGSSHKLYTDDDINPQSVYGLTKLQREKELLSINPEKSIIIRTSWVYSSFGNNFVKIMLRLGIERESLNVIFDQIGTPTYARDLANAAIKIIPLLNNKDVEVFNYSNEGVLSCYGTRHGSGVKCIRLKQRIIQLWQYDRTIPCLIKLK